MMIPSRARVGVFDSGVGGLTVLRKLVAAAPGADYEYLGDTARVPYGTRSPETVIEYSLSSVQYLESLGADVIVVACNTASALALEQIRRVSKLPVVGVIDDGVSAALEVASERIVVLGTRATVASRTYEIRIREVSPGTRVLSVACPLFVPIVEEGLADTAIARDVAGMYLQSIDLGGTEAILLACTHFPIMQSALRAHAPPPVRIVDPSHKVANRVASMLPPSARSGNGRIGFHVTDACEGFARVASAMGLGLNGSIQHVTLPVR